MTSLLRALFAAAIPALLIGSPPATAAVYVTGVPPVRDAAGQLRDWSPTAVSFNGSVIVGHTGGGNAGDFGVRFENGRTERLPELPGGVEQSRVMGVSADGSTTFGFSEDDQGTRPVTWTGGQIKIVAPLIGAVLAASADASVLAVGADHTLYRLEGGVLTEAPCPPGSNGDPFPVFMASDGSAMVGKCGSNTVRWDGTVATVINGPQTLRAASADLSALVGINSFNASNGQAVVWRNGVEELISTPANSYAAAVSVTADGTVVFGSGSHTGSFVWQPARGTLFIEPLLVALFGWHTPEVTDHIVGAIRAASGDGRIVVGGGFFGTVVLIADDPDGDRASDLFDNCPVAANADQADRGSIGSGSAPDGIGDACQCGDVNGDGTVTAVDAVLISRSLLAPPTATLTRPELCDVGGAMGCSPADAVIVRRALLQPAMAAIQQVCAPATP